MPIVARLAGLLGAAALAAGCSTLISNLGLDPEVEAQAGNPYSGARLNLKSWRCLPSVAGEYPPAASVFLVPISAALLLADLPLSAIADTALLPLDLSLASGAEPIHPFADECD